jgi:hypothetical protein
VSTPLVFAGFVDAGALRSVTIDTPNIAAGFVDAGAVNASSLTIAGAAGIDGGLQIKGSVSATNGLSAGGAAIVANGINSAGAIVAGTTIQAGTYVEFNGVLYNDSGGTHKIGDSTAPTISSGFGSGASIPNHNTNWAFTVNVGTGGAANTGVIALGTAATGWVCSCQDVTTPASFVTAQTGGTSSTANFTNYSRTTGLIIAWTASDASAARRSRRPAVNQR